MYLGRQNIYGLFEKQLLANDTPGVPQNNYTLAWTVGSTTSILVVTDGVFLEPGLDYAVGLDGKNISFTTPPDPNVRTYLIYLARELQTPRTIGIEPILKSFTGSLGQTDFDLDNLPVNGDSLIVFVDGVQKRYVEDFTFSGKILQFTVAPADGAKISVYIHGVERFDVFGDLPNEPIIDTIHIYNEAVTREKIQDGAITYEKLSLPIVDCASFYDLNNPGNAGNLSTFGGMNFDGIPVINLAEYRQKWGNTIELHLDLTCRFTGVAHNALRFRIPIKRLANEVSPLGIVTLETDVLLETGIQRWGGAYYIDVHRQNGINYTLGADWRFRIKFNYEYIE
jgi:hypothetical protein